MPTYSITINKKKKTVNVAEDTPLLWVLRDHLQMLGTKYGCGIAQCGACTVHIDGQPTRACVLPVSAVGKAKITTIEGLSETGTHPVQQAWDEVDVAQCGYCQAGQMMSAAALLATNPTPTKEEIALAMQGNICRCGTYHRIEEAILKASTKSKP